MRKLFRMILLMLILIIGCTHLPSSQTPPPLGLITYTPTRSVLTSTSTVAITRQTIPTHNVLASTEPVAVYTPTITSIVALVQEVISPQLVTVCTEQQVVSFEALELPQDFRLLLLPGSVESYPQIPAKPLILSPGNSTPKPFLDDELLSYEVSPDYQWISFYRPGDEDNHSILWISSLDGQKQWPVMQLGGKGYMGFASWVSAQEMFIIGSPIADEPGELNMWTNFPFLSVNPFTMEQQPLTYLAGDRTQGRYYYGVMSSEGYLYTLYGRLNMVDYLYDYAQEKALPVFQWINEVDIGKMIATVMKPIWVYDGEKFAVMVARPDGLDLAMGLGMIEASESKRYNEVMKKILLPEYLLPFSVLGIAPGNSQILLQRFDRVNYDIGPYWLYVLDFPNMTIRDYCFDPGDLWPIKFSPDGRFIAFSKINDAMDAEQDRHYIGIFDLEKGVVAYLEGYKLIDWGMVSEEP